MHPFYRPRRRWLRWMLIYVVGVVTVFVVGLVIETGMSPGPKHPANFTTSVPTPPWASAQASTSPPARKPAPPPPSPAGPSLTGPLALIAGSQTVNGVELGFPQSTAGAVSAAADTAGEVFSTLDPDRAAAVMRMTADPSYPGAPLQAAQGAATDRQSLGIPLTGPVPAGYSVLAQPVEYQVRDVTAGSVTVLLLSDFTTAQPGTGTQTRVGVFSFRMHWTEGDWKVAVPGSASYVNLAAEPFSPQAAALGWQELLPQEAAVNVKLPSRPAQLHRKRDRRGSK
jgi:hypothetical protein